MDEATQATTPTASTTLTTDRASYQRAAAVATRIVGRLAVFPRAVETYADFTGHAIRLHFGTGLTAGRGVLETADIADTEVTRDESTYGVFVECTTTIEGIPLVARALLTQDDADELMQKTPTPQPVRLGASVLAHVPAVTAVPPIGGEQ